MLRAGEVYLVDIPDEKTDHYWILVTDINEKGEVAYAMLTDARNIEDKVQSFPQGTLAWNSFRLLKETAVDAARAKVHGAHQLERALKSNGRFQGVAEPQFLSAVREALRSDPATPDSVREML